jgi:DNA-binding NtrC family response regulator
MSPDAPRVLVVDDERLLHGVMERLLNRHGIAVTSCLSPLRAVELLAEEPFDLVITDFRMPEMDGFELLAHIRERYPDLGVVIITGHANVQHAVRAMAHGAVDYLPKPFSTDVLLERVQGYLARRAERAAAPEAPAAPAAPARPAKGRRSSAPATGPVPFVGEHPSVLQLKAFVPRIAASKAAVFVHGESGVGKEVMARLLHSESDRATGPFVALNCANLPRELVESHLFGHRKGAFTGAVEDMAGAFEQANGGTLLLDEVTEVDPNVQAKLLRVLQEQEFTRVGETKPTRVDVRVVATSNRDLQQAVADGTFRADLYHRLAVFPLHVPPLRARKSDILLLVERFVEKYCALYGLTPKTLAPELLAQFRAYDWPGNVRELENMVHRGVVMAADRAEVEAEDVMNPFFTSSAEVHTAPGLAVPTHRDGRPLTIAEVEREMILEALAAADGNQRVAADQLGICSRTIRNKLKKYREDGVTDLRFVG